jgi:hypothetical protein
LSLVLSLVLISIGLGQAKSISEDQFARINEKSRELQFGMNYRVKQTRTSKVNGVQSSPNELSVNEFIRPDKKRHVSEMTAGNATRKVELIVIGNKKYSRRENGSWKVSVLEKKEEKSLSQGSVQTNQLSNEIKYRGKEKLNGEEVDVYDISKITKSTSEKKQTQPDLASKITYWFNKDGLVVKYLNEENVLTESLKITSTQMWIYEYNPKDLKIEAPIK